MTLCKCKKPLWGLSYNEKRALTPNPFQKRCRICGGLPAYKAEDKEIK